MLTRHGVVVNDEYPHILGPDSVFRAGREPPLRHPQRDSDGEGGAGALLALDRNAAVHHLDDVLCNRHSESGAAVFVRLVRVLLGESLEDFRDKLLVHAHARVPDDKAQGRVSLKLRQRFHDKGDSAAFGRELHGVAEDVDEDLLELHVVADVIILNVAIDPADIVEALVLALAVDHCIDLLQYLAEGKFLVSDRHAPAFDAAHIEDVVDEAQQVLRAAADLFEVLP